MKPNSFWHHQNEQKLGTYIPKPGRGKNLINFAALENAFGCSPVVTKKIQKLTCEPLNSYPGSEMENLRVKIATWLKIRPGMILLGNGSDELINLVPQVFLEPEENVVVQTPTFFRILESVHRMKGNIIKVNTASENGFALGKSFTKELLGAIKITRPKIVWLCSPNNPTGVVMDVELIDKIAGETDALVVVDEVYQEFFDPENKKSAIRLLGKHKNILVTKSFSKAFGLAGIRVGLAVGTPEIIGALAKWQLNFPVSILSAKIAQNALEDQNFLKQTAKKFSDERRFLFEKIKKLENIQVSDKSQTNVFILRHRNKNIFDLLLKEEILTANFNQMNGLEDQNFVRITVKQRRENQLLINALRKIN